MGARLTEALASWRSAERLAPSFPVFAGIADARFHRLTELALAAGFRPGREHAAVSVVEFSAARATRSVPQ